VGYECFIGDPDFRLLEVALEREVEGDLFLQDIGQGFGFRAGSFDGAIRYAFTGMIETVLLTQTIASQSFNGYSMQKLPTQPRPHPIVWHGFSGHFIQLFEIHLEPYSSSTPLQMTKFSS